MTAEMIKRRIQSRMALLGLNGDDMAAKLHIAPCTWSRWLRYPERIRVENLNKLEKILKCKLFTED